MAASIGPSLADVAKALETLTSEETKHLIIRFGVPLNVVIDIETEHKTSSSRKTHTIQAWLDKDTGSCWEKIISGLIVIGKDVLAKEVAIQHCPQSPYVATSSSDTSQPTSILTTQPVTTPAPVTPAIASVVANASADDSEQSPNTANSDCTQAVAVITRSVAIIKATILRLEDTFSDLISCTRSALCERERQDNEFLDKFRDRLLVLSVAKKAAHVKFFRESEDDILEAKNIRKIFAILSRYWSYRNYEILLKIIESFYVDLQQRMQDYCESLERFEKATTVDVYLTAVPDETSEEVVSAFSEMVMKINKPASECTLYELRKLNEAIIEGSSLCVHSVYIGSVADKCVELVVRFPSSVVGWVLSAMTPAFMHTHFLIEMEIDGRQLAMIEADSDKLNDELIAASRAGDEVKVVSLLNSGADINTVNRFSATALYCASRNGHLQVVHLLLARGSVECKDENQWTPLITAAFSGACDVVLDLLDSGADVNAQDDSGYSALIEAARWNHSKVVVELVKGKANLDLQDEDGYSALIWAAMHGHVEVVVELVKAKASLDLQNERGDSAVIIATVQHGSHVLRVLVEAGSNLNVQNEEGLTAVMISARSGRSDITDILVGGEHIDLDIQENSTGWSALHFAAERGDVTTTHSLLKAGANALLQDKNGLTALAVARASSSKEGDDADRVKMSHKYDGVVDLLSAYTAEPAHLPSYPEQDSTAGQQDRVTDQDSTPGQQDIVSNQDSTTTDIQSSGQRGQRRRVSLALRNLVNVSRQRIQHLFNDLNRRFKSADRKD